MSLGDGLGGVTHSAAGRQGKEFLVDPGGGTGAGEIANLDGDLVTHLDKPSPR